MVRDIEKLYLNKHNELQEGEFVGEVIVAGIASSLSGEQLTSALNVLKSRHNFFVEQNGLSESISLALDRIENIRIALNLDPENSPPQYDAEDAAGELDEIRHVLKKLFDDLKKPDVE